MSTFELVEREKERVMEHQKEAIKADFTKKMIEYKKQQTGNEYRLFGQTMVSLEQLHFHVKEDTCM